MPGFAFRCPAWHPCVSDNFRHCNPRPVKSNPLPLLLPRWSGKASRSLSGRERQFYRIGKQEFFTLLRAITFRMVVSRVAKHIFFPHACLTVLTEGKERIHKARLSGIGIADQRDSRNSRSISFVFLLFALPPVFLILCEGRLFLPEFSAYPAQSAFLPNHGWKGSRKHQFDVDVDFPVSRQGKGDI